MIFLCRPLICSHYYQGGLHPDDQRGRADSRVSQRSVHSTTPALMHAAEMGLLPKTARTMTTLGLVVVGFFWTSGGFYVSSSLFVNASFKLHSS